MSREASLDAFAAAMARLFPVTQPDMAVWTDVVAIGNVLGELGTSGAVWTSAPDGRHETLRAVSAGDEAATIEVATDGARYLMRPERLELEFYEGHLLTWFRLTTTHLGSAPDSGRLSLAEHGRVRVKAGSTFVFCATASPLPRAATDRDYASWDADRFKDFVWSLQQTMMMETQ